MRAGGGVKAWCGFYYYFNGVDVEELKEIKKLFKLMVQENLYELIIEETDFKVIIKRKINFPSVSNINTKEEISEPEETIEDSSNIVSIHCVEIVSPINGVFYRSPSPEAASFVEVGSIINKGGTICIVEAMKLMNEIQVEQKCKIIKIFVENGVSVIESQALFLVEIV